MPSLQAQHPFPDRWFAASDLAGLPGLPGTERRVRSRAEREFWTARKRTAGKGVEYALESLPPVAQAALLLRDKRIKPANATCARDPKFTEQRIAAAHDRYEAAKQPMKSAAQQRHKAVLAVEALQRSGLSIMQARAAVAAQLQREGQRGASAGNIARWQEIVDGAHRSDWLFLLVPHYAGCTSTVAMAPEAWESFKGDWLRLEAPSAESCYRRLQRMATANPHWMPLPSARTFIRRIERELPRAVRVLARKGEEALMKTYPAQERDRAGFGALEGVNADGHKWDVAVTFPDGTVGRPTIVGWQDLASGKMLAWRMAETESSDLVRLAFADMVRTFGIPHAAWLDNGRAFASKFMTGGTPNRYRFKVRAEDPEGVITGLGVKVHWVTPYHGQAKPIERAWRDFCDSIAKHPAFAGAYLGNNPTAKPENYGSRAVPWQTFVDVVNSEIAAHNARVGRRSAVCNGRSFDHVFAESYAKTTIRKASEAQLRMLLLPVEAATASPVNGSVRFAGNRYWVEALAPFAGRKVQLRFDPDALHSGVHCYALDNSYIGFADCVATVGFADTNAAREHSRATKHYRKAAKEMLSAERRMDASMVAAQLPTTQPETVPPPGVVAPRFGMGASRDQKPALARTGTDDSAATESTLNEFLKRVQEGRDRDRL